MKIKMLIFGLIFLISNSIEAIKLKNLSNHDFDVTLFAKPHGHRIITKIKSGEILVIDEINYKSFSINNRSIINRSINQALILGSPDFIIVSTEEDKIKLIKLWSKKIDEARILLCVLSLIVAEYAIDDIAPIKIVEKVEEKKG